MTRVNLPAFYLGVQEELEKISRCWEGYEPVPGKEAYSEDSCRPKRTKKKEKKANLGSIETSVPKETPEAFLARIRQDNINFPRFLSNAQQHKWNLPGVPFSNSLVQGFIKNNKDNPQAIKDRIQSAPDKRILEIIKHNPDAFKGVQAQPSENPITTKIGFDVSSMPVNENILPSISNQSKWKYVRTKDGLKLTDGNLVYTFGGFPDEFPGEDLKVSRLKDDNILDFEKDALGKGTAQVHRSSPDNIYMTLADGDKNPTFMLQHEKGQNWRYSPSKKFIEKLKLIQSKISPETSKEKPEEYREYENNLLLDPKSLFKGAEDFCKKALDPAHPTLGMDSEDLANLIKRVGYGAVDLGNKAIDTASRHPIATAASIYGVSRGISGIRDMISPERKQLREMDPSKKLENHLSSIVFAGLPVLAARAIKTE